MQTACDRERLSARRQIRAAQIPRRCRAPAYAQRGKGHRRGSRPVAPKRCEGGAMSDGGWPRRVVSRIDGRGRGGLPRREAQGRGFSLHPLHLRLDRQTQGRGPQHRRLSALERADPQVRFRPPRRRRLFLHRRHWVGHRPQLCGLWPAVQWRHHAHVRGRARRSPTRDASGKWSRSSR